MQKVARKDEQGFWIEDVILEDNEPIPEDCDTDCPPDGFHWPRKVNGQWVEGLTQEEIDARQVPPEPSQTEILQQQVAALEQDKLNLQLALAEAVEKQEADKLNNQLAIAELIEELVSGGVLL